MDQQKENNTPLLVLSTFPDGETARQIGTALVERQLAACVNVLPEIESIYRWKGTMEHDREILGLIKTTSAALEGLKAAIAELHPYEVPEVIAVEIAEGSAPYLDWLVETVRPPGD